MKNQRVIHSKARKNTLKKDSAMDKTIKSSFLGILISVGVGFALMFASTAAALLTDDPTAFIEPIGYVLPFVCAVLGGFVCSKLNKSSPYLTSVICALEVFLLSAAASLALPDHLSSDMSHLLRFLLLAARIPAYVFGALVGVKASKPQRRAIKRR